MHCNVYADAVYHTGKSQAKYSLETGRQKYYTSNY